MDGAIVPEIGPGAKINLSPDLRINLGIDFVAQDFTGKTTAPMNNLRPANS